MRESSIPIWSYVHNLYGSTTPLLVYEKWNYSEIGEFGVVRLEYN